MRLFLLGLASVVGVLTANAAFAADAPTRTKATIDQVSAKTLTVTTVDGQKLTVDIEPDTAIAGMSKISLTDIGPNSFIGTAAKKQPDGTLRAMEVHVFPESMRGAGEGHRGWYDGPDSSMTNGTVSSAGSVSATDGRTLTVTYKGGEQHIVVPQNVPVVLLQKGDPSLLVAGAHVSITGSKGADGVIDAKRISVGINGVVPPV